MPSRDRFLKTCHCEKVDRPPVWLMRQAGRHLPEYQALRAKHSFLEMLTQEELITEISLQPWRRYRMDAVIVFSDILLLPMTKGMELKFLEGQGPKFPKLIATRKDLKNLKAFDPKNISFLSNALKKIKREIENEAALLGFAGSPWTVASYTTQGFDSLRRTNPALLKEVLEMLVVETTAYLKAKIEAGADAIQIFDTWGGTLSIEEYREWSAPYIQAILSNLRPTGIPTILYVRDSAHLLPLMVETGCDVISIGWETELAKAKEVAKGNVAIQGNLNSHILAHATAEEVRTETQNMLKKMADYPGYIANLGHGVLPKTPIENVEAFVKAVKQ